MYNFTIYTDKASWIGGLGGGGRISHCFHFEFTLSSHWISQRVHFDFTFDLKGKGKASRAEREKGKGLDDLLGSFPLGNGHRAYARTNETKRFPGKGLPPNLRYIYIYIYVYASIYLSIY